MGKEQEKYKVETYKKNPINSRLNVYHRVVWQRLVNNFRMLRKINDSVTSIKMKK